MIVRLVSTIKITFSQDLAQISEKQKQRNGHESTKSRKEYNFQLPKESGVSPCDGERCRAKAIFLRDRDRF